MEIRDKAEETMKPQKTGLNAAGIAALVIMCGCLPAVAGVLNFDSISTGGTLVAIPSGYGGFTWDTNIGVMNNAYYNSTYGDSSISFPSMPNAVYQGSGVISVTITGAPFSFQGADFATWLEFNSEFSDSSTSVTVNGYLSGVLVGTDTMTLNTNGTFSFLTTNFSDVDTLTILNSGASNKWWLMDNFTYGAVSAVPEPSSVLLLATGLIALGAIRKRARNGSGCTSEKQRTPPCLRT